MPLTATKAKLVTKKLHHAVDSMNTIPWEKVAAIASSENVKADEVATLAEQLGYDVRRAPQKQEVEAPIPPAPVKSIPPKGVKAPSDLVKRQIMVGGIYRQLGQHMDLTMHDSDYVLTTFGEWKRERDAIAAWIKSLGGHIPAIGE